MRTAAIILARAGSKGLPDKCVRPLLGRPVIAYTIDHAQASRHVHEIVLTTDSEAAAAIGTEAGVQVVDRPPELATDSARVDAVVRHAVQCLECHCPWDLEGECSHALCHAERVQNVVILYGNIPVRADGIIDRCVDLLVETGCSSVRTLAPVTKQHPDWIHRLDGDRMTQFRANSIHRRQDLEPLYYHDGAVIAVTRESLFAAADSDDPHAFFGPDRRGVVQQPEDAVDIDAPVDLYLAEAILRHRAESASERPESSPLSAVLNLDTLVGVSD